ncbi:aminotransferase class I/II-fold pyridoxal phosphate-dependent enzyme [Siminovitchia sediminis]|uniref:Aminotransferase class I/II-fold pyridoxal phosphate-dependent enzyme n=1 Tax=Siminovitchia sediminis TaxID=1274353 RepID=A0ABW4KHI0_9BACI
MNRTDNLLTKEKRPMDHTKAPLYEALCKYEKANHTSLHVPGHKDGRVFDLEAQRHFSEILKIDATCSNGIDDLHQPKDSIKEAQDLAANAFGADQTFFLVGGSTIGNLGIALTLCKPGDKVLVQRNMHKSVFNGLLLAGAQPVYISPAIESETKAAMVSDLHYIEEALKEDPDIKGVWVTNPNYYGMSQDLKRISEACRQAGVPLVVDEAHGAHFGQAEEVPPSALSMGANLVIQSTHKMLTALHMSSMLHVKGDLVDLERLERVLGMIQSTSPSYLLLGSLDLARRYLVVHGRNQMRDTVKRLEKRRVELSSELQSLTIWAGSPEVQYRDPLKWIIASKNEGVSGYQLLDLFHEEGAVAEISDPRNIVFLFSLNENEADIEKVVRAITAVDQRIQIEPAHSRKKAEVSMFDEEGTLSAPELSLQDAFNRPRRKVKLDDAAGLLCGETVLPYPPGIPLLNPGEKITERHIETIKQLHEMGAYFQSPSDLTMDTLYVIQ